MAIDEYLLEEQLNGGVPTLRLYAFNPPTVTIGLSQKISADTIDRIKSKGFDVTRRPTGGRAVLHYKDLTYSFLARDISQQSGGILARSVSAAYKQICAGLQNAFEILGVKAELGSSAVPYRHLADCFLATTNADLQFDGKKLAGSAQLRRRGAVLQHGSIPLNLEQGLMLELLEGENRTDSPELAAANRHANLFDALGQELPQNELCQAIREGFERAFAHAFVESPLSDEELQGAKKFLQSESFLPG